MGKSRRGEGTISHSTTVLVTGAGGFLGSAIVERLLTAGHSVIACTHGSQNQPSHPRLSIQPVCLERMRNPADWATLLTGVNAIVHCAGILRERRRGDFDRIHYTAPMALAQACVRAGIGPFVHISALGDPQDGEFIASKHRFDDVLASMDLPTWILRPSVVVSLRGSYGGTSALRAGAALPGFLVLPGKGDQHLQPVLLDDLVEVVRQAVEKPDGHPEPLPIAGPEVMTIRELLLAMRSWLRLPERRYELCIPERLVTALATVSDRLRLHPMGKTTWRMLQRGNVARKDSSDAVRQSLGIELRSVPEAFQSSASFVQDRWHARLKNLVPLAWLSLVLIWLVSGLTGLVAGPDQYQPVLEGIGLAPHLHAAAAKSTGILNLALGIWLAFRWRMRTVLWLMLISVLAYSVVLGIGMPTLWLDLPGGLVKNAAVLSLIAFSIVTCSER